MMTDGLLLYFRVKWLYVTGGVYIHVCFHVGVNDSYCFVICIYFRVVKELSSCRGTGMGELL